MSKETQVEKQKAFQKYVAKIAKMNKEQLEKEEQKVVKEADKINDEVVAKKFKLQPEGYKEAAEAIQFFLDKQEIDQSLLGGLITMYEFWDPTKVQKEVDFPTLDSSLRYIGGLRFKGYVEWKKAVKIIEYFKYLYDEYGEVTEKIYDIAERHSAILDKLKLFDSSQSNAKQINS